MILLPHRLLRAAALVLRILLTAGSIAATSSFGAPLDQRLANLSTRGQVGTGANIMITGFVVQGRKDVLIRAVGPRLSTAPFNLAGTLANPKLDLFRGGESAPFLTNDNWISTDATAMSAVGAFALNFNSLDSAIVTTLDAGVYTAQVTGVSNGTGISLLEVYDVTGSPRLMNLSTRAVVGKDSNMLISGLVVSPSGGIRKVLIRAIGPSLAPLGVVNPLSDPVFSVIDSSNRVIASSDNWSSGTASEISQLTAAFTAAGAFPLALGSKDSALIVDLPPNTGVTSYTIQVSNVDASTGPGLIEVYDLTPDASAPTSGGGSTPPTSPVTLPIVSVLATNASTDNNGAPPAVFTISRLGTTANPLTVSYTVSGSAVSGVDYTALTGSVSFAAGVSSVAVPLTPKVTSAVGASKTVTLSIAPGASYSIDSASNATVAIFFGSGSLYVANLRTGSSVTASTAYGTATVKLSPDEQSAFINVSFANLSSPEVVAHLVVDGNYVYNLSQGQVNGAYWTFDATGSYSKADLIAALKAGRVYVSIDTANYPTAELTGTFLRSSGSSAFTTPAAAPAVVLNSVTQQDAARFLTQATFGPTTAEITALTTKGYNTWIAEQIAKAPTLQRTETMADFVAYPPSATATAPSTTNRQAAWWKTVITGQDQLRQRVAFALSELFVISDQNGTINAFPEATANYYDILVKGAFGNFRTLLEDVTLSPMMGVYLSSLRNAKAAGTSMPDENYAREIMQLFTVGLNDLQPDGSLKFDGSGQPIPTYNQTTVVETAKIFTGWAFNQTVANPNFRGGTADYFTPMMLYPAFHEDAQKVIVGGKIIPANQGGAKDLKDTLDALFNHGNTAPFISRQLIQRLVTSNPSPGYVYRVAQVFANNGSGVRGDLAAVIKAILLDYEARSPALLNTPGHGKMKEPLLRTTSLLRAFSGGSNSGRFNISNPETSLAQASLRATTVFNFFEPDYIQPGALAAAGLYAPEFQILTDTTAITVPNFLYNYIQATRSTTDMTQQTIALDFAALLPMAKTAQPLVDALNLPLCGGTMPTAMRDRIVTALNAMPANTADLDRIRSAVYLVVTSPEASIQK